MASPPTPAIAWRPTSTRRAVGIPLSRSWTSEAPWRAAQAAVPASATMAWRITPGRPPR